MKKILLFGLTLVLLAGCQFKKSTETKGETDTHNAQTSLDVDGSYEGLLPAASGGGMKVFIVLSGNTYSKHVSYEKDPGKTFDTSGTFTWDAKGSVITLEGEDAPNKYVVGENTLTQLDIEGNKITGNLADQYILRK